MYLPIPSSAAAVAAGILLLSALPAGAGAQRMYGKSSPVLQVDAKTWDRQIVKAHLPSIVEFYAPWCGHCQNLKPAYEKAASSLAGIVQIAAVNCDEDANKGLCGELGVQGFPTLKTVRPAALIGLGAKDSKAKDKAGKKNKPAISDYRGPRSAKEIAEAAKALLPNTVARVTDADVDEWLAAGNDSAKALLFSDKGTTSALLKALALDFRGSMAFAQVRDREDAVTDAFGIETYPTLVVLPGGSQAAVSYDGEMNKADMLAFLRQYAEPVTAAKKNAEPSAESKNKSKSKSKSKKADTKASEAKPPAADETLDDDPAADSPQPTVEGVPKPASVPVDAPPALPTLATPEELAAKCLGPTTLTCVIALLPATMDDSNVAITELAAVSAKARAANTHIFPVYAAADAATGRLRRGLVLEQDDGQVQLLAVNGKRGWVRIYEPAVGEPATTVWSASRIESWIEGVKLGDVKKQKLPADLLRNEAATEAEAEPEVKDEL